MCNNTTNNARIVFITYDFGYATTSVLGLHQFIMTHVTKTIQIDNIDNYYSFVVNKPNGRVKFKGVRYGYSH